MDSRECQHVTGLHRHNRTDEASYVIERRPNVFVNGKVHRLRAGDYVFIPRRTPHAQGQSGELLTKMAQGSAEFAAAMAVKQKDYDIEPLGPTPPGLAELR